MDGWVVKKKTIWNSPTTIHGESGSVNIEAIREQSELVKYIVEDHNPANVKNCDETGLTIKHTTSRRLSFKQVEGKKMVKNRFSIFLCYNRDGSHKYKPWFVRTALRHRSFDEFNIKSIGCVWKKSKNACMMSDMFEEWLVTFHRDARQREKQVLLLMDKASVHKCAVTSTENSQFLANTTPPTPNSTSKVQPFDQGISKPFKAQY